MKTISFMLFFNSIALFGFTQDEGNYTDPRDGEVYNTITYRTRRNAVVWMTTNIRYKTNESWAPKHNEEFAKTVGRLYTWKSAQSACPEGWHISTKNDWKLLSSLYGGVNAADSLRRIKSNNKRYNENGSFALSVIPGGGVFNGIEFLNFGSSYWWAPHIQSIPSSIVLFMQPGSQFIETNYDAESAMAVRCVMYIK